MIKIESKENDNAKGKNSIISPLDLELVVISGEHDITTGAIRLLLANNADMIILDSFGNPAGYIMPCGKGRLMERFDAQSKLNPVCALNIAKMICVASINNKVSLLRSIQKNTGIDIEAEIETIRKTSEQAEKSIEINSLLGNEGFSANEYYSAIKKIIPNELGFKGRNRNPPMDAVNALLGYGYGILYSKIRSAIVRAGLSPYYGVLHSSYKEQEALVYDLIEEFRQPVVDRAILTLIARKQVSPDDFEVTSEGCMINNIFKKRYAEVILTRLEQEYAYENEKKSFSEIIDAQADKLAAAIFETCKYSPFIYR